MINVFLVDDHEMVRQALARILEESGAIRVIGGASNGRDAIAGIREHRPDVLVLDFGLPDLQAPDVLELMSVKGGRVNTLVLTVHENIHYAVRVLEAGARGYLIKSAAVDELVEAIRTIHDGGIYISKAVAADVLAHLRNPRRERVGLNALSGREFEFLAFLASGKSLQECARLMNVTTSTASTYRSRILEKLGLKSTSDLIRFAIENGVTE